MANYKSEDVTLGVPVERAFAKLDNLEGLGELIKNAPADKIPAEQRDMLDKISVTSDTISFPSGPMGEIRLRKVKSVEPTLIELAGEGTPVPMSLKLHLLPMGETACTANVEIDLQIPAMLKPMVNGPLKKMTTEFANMLRQMPF